MFLSIGQASQAVGVAVSTLRRWEREGSIVGRYEVIDDLGSGLNYKKRGLKKLIQLILSGRVDCLNGHI